MKLGSMFPATKTLAQALPTAVPLSNDAATAVRKGLLEVLKAKKPGDFKIAWPKFKAQEPKDYQVITKVKTLVAYLARCEFTGYGGFDYETAANQQERDRFAWYENDLSIRRMAAKGEAGDDVKLRDKLLQSLEDEYDAARKEHLLTPLDPWKSDLCSMSLSAKPHEARAIFVSHKKGTNLFEPQLGRNEARALLMDTLERHFFTNTKILKVAVNLAFESKLTAKYGKYVLMPVADPFVAWVRITQLTMPHKITNPKKPTSGKGLKPMTFEVFGVHMNEFRAVLDKHGADFYDEVDSDSPDALIYCCEDSDYAVQHEIYWDEVAKQIPTASDIYTTYSAWLHNIEMPFSRVIGLMEYWGMYWDKDLSGVKREEAALMQTKAADEIKRIAKDTLDLDVNPGKSGKTGEIKSLLFDVLKVPASSWSEKTKDPSLDSNAIMDMTFMLENKLLDPEEEKYLGTPLPEGWEAIDPEKDPNLDKATRQRVRIEQRQPHPYREAAIALLDQLKKIQKYNTLLSSHIIGREKYLNEVTDRIHASYTPWTETSRLNSMRPNGQNVPTIQNDEFGIRNFYRAPDGKVLFLIDYAGFELRLMAWKSNDEVMLDIFKHNGDMHRKTAATLTGKAEVDVTKDERKDAKSGNFGISYGGTEHALQKTFKKFMIRKSLDECKLIVDAVKATYKRIPEYQHQAIITSRDTGYAECIYGYMRLLPTINSSNNRARGEDERRAGNTPIQGTAAEIMKRSQTTVYEKIGLDTASKNLSEKVEVWGGFIPELKTLLEEPPMMEHGKTDMISQIHDEIIFQFEDNPCIVKVAGEWVKRVMEVPPVQGFPLPIVADASAAYSWGTKESVETYLERKGLHEK